MVLSAILLVGVFLSGSWFGSRKTVTETPSKVKSLPSGSAEEPESESKEDLTSLPSGAVEISPEKQQIIGVKIEVAEQRPWTYVIRASGRVVVDENRIYRLLSPSEGWVRKIVAGTTGSVVRKNEILAYFYSRDILTPQQAYFYALNALDRFKKEGLDTPQQVSSSNAQIRSAEDQLYALGMGNAQIKEIAKTRQAAADIEITSPVEGLVLQRNIFFGERFDRGAEWYRIADISRVWILADIFENETQYFRKGVSARVILPHQKKVFMAKPSNVPPQFDATTRTMKVRLEMDNPGLILRPDMFVDVELLVKLPSALTVPTSAVLDSGLRQTVFVDHGNGYFEPRKVETGLRYEDRVEILKGLKTGERIVVAGTFLIDSESRLKMPSGHD